MFNKAISEVNKSRTINEIDRVKDEQMEMMRMMEVVTSPSSSSLPSSRTK